MTETDLSGRMISIMIGTKNRLTIVRPDGLLIHERTNFPVVLFGGINIPTRCSVCDAIIPAGPNYHIRILADEVGTYREIICLDCCWYFGMVKVGEGGGLVPN